MCKTHEAKVYRSPVLERELLTRTGQSYKVGVVINDADPKTADGKCPRANSTTHTHDDVRITITGPDIDGDLTNGRFQKRHADLLTRFYAWYTPGGEPIYNMQLIRLPA